MPFCTKCGSIINADAKFCQQCGSPREISGNVGNIKSRKLYDGEIHKCPNCGEIIEAFIPNCPTCGYELRGIESNNSIQKFLQTYNLLNSNIKKLELIKNYTVPNTREDILEFIILASSNVSNANNENGVYEIGASPQELASAWMIKFEQAYQKATIVLQGDPYLERIEQIYSEKKRILDKTEKKATKDEKKKKVKLFLMILSPFILVFGIFAIVFLIHAINVRDLENIVEEIEELIIEEKYDNALIKAEQLHCDDGFSHESEEKWDIIRESIISRIENLKKQEREQFESG